MAAAHHPRFLRAQVGALLALALLACGDIPSVTDAAVDTVVADAPSDATPPTDAPTDGPAVADLTGSFLIGFETSFGSIALAWTVTAGDRAADGSYPITSTLRPLARGSLAPVGSLYTVAPTTVSAGAQVSFAVRAMVLPPAATGAGTDIRYDADFLAMIVSPSRLCGTLPSGMVTNPVQTSLSGLAWAAERARTDGSWPPLLTRCP